MKIAFVFREIKESSNTAYMPIIIKYFISKGHEVEIFAQNIDFLPYFKFHKLPQFGSNPIINEVLTTTGNILKLDKSKFDLVYSRANTRYLFADISSLDFLFKSWSGNESNLTLKSLTFGEKISFLFKKYIIAVSNLMKNEIMKNYGIQESRIKVIHNGVDTKIFNKKNRHAHESKEIIKKYIENGEKLILHVGNKPFRKGLPYLIKAMKIIKNGKLLVIGLNENDIEHFKRVSRDFGVEEKIIFMGMLKHTELKYYYAASDIFVLPTFFDPCAVATFEAMASGCVPIDSIYNGSAELIEHGKSGFVLRNPKKSYEIANYINLLINDQNLFKRMQRNSLIIAKDRDWNVVAKEWERFFQEVYERRRTV